MKKIALVAMLSAVVATPALADNTGSFYGAVDLGSVSLGNIPSQFGNTSFPNPSAFRLAGGFNITPMFAVEAGYAMIGDSKITTTQGALSVTETFKTSSLQVAGVANYAINDTFGVFGKLGFANTKIDYTAIPGVNTVITAGTTAASGSKTNLTFGLGAQYNINKQFAIRAQYEDFGKVKLGNATNDIGITMMSVGGVYTF